MDTRPYWRVYPSAVNKELLNEYELEKTMRCHWTALNSNKVHRELRFLVVFEARLMNEQYDSELWREELNITVQ